jgi:predicted TIM-barrel fold metal-dependent hydrolase
MSGPTSPSLEYNDPTPLANVARAFPHLPIVCYHGFYPYVNEAIGIAFRYENIHLVPDMYLFMPGSSLYVEAANGFMRDQLLFGTSYPFRAMRQTIDDFLQLGIKEEALEQVLYANAQRLVKL